MTQLALIQFFVPHYSNLANIDQGNLGTPITAINLFRTTELAARRAVIQALAEKRTIIDCWVSGQSFHVWEGFSILAITQKPARLIEKEKPSPLKMQCFSRRNQTMSRCVFFSKTEPILPSGPVILAEFNMSQLDFYKPDAELRVRQNVKRCRSCWRDEVHVPIKLSPILFGFLFVVTLGLILTFRPSRCTCCGTKRML
jgi:hypothetical protein